MTAALAKHDTRAALVQAAVTLAARGGVGAIGLREAARAAGLTHGAPYRHFEDRNALVAATAEEGFRELMTCCLAAQARVADDPLARFQELGVAYLTFALTRPGLFRVMFGAEAAVHPAVRAAEAAVFALAVNAIATAQRQGLIIDDDPQELAMFAWASVHGMASLVLDGLAKWVGLEVTDAEKLARRLTLRVYRGLARSAQVQS